MISILKNNKDNDYQFDKSINLLSPIKKDKSSLQSLSQTKIEEEQNELTQVLKKIIKSPQAADYLKDLSFPLNIEEDQKNIVELDSFSLSASGFDQKNSQIDSGLDKSQKLQSIKAENSKFSKSQILDYQANNNDREVASQKQIIREKCKSFSTSAKSPKKISLINQPSFLIQTNNKDVLLQQNFLTQQGQRKSTYSTKNQLKEKLNISPMNQLQLGEKSKSDSKDLKFQKDYLIQKKANSYFNLQNLMDFHSKRQLLKNIRNLPGSRSSNSRHNSMQNDSYSQLSSPGRRLIRESEVLNVGYANFYNKPLEGIQEKGYMENIETDISNEAQNNNHLRNKIAQKYFQKRKLQQKKGINNNPSLDKELRMSDYFFHGSQHSHQKSLQVRLQVDQEQDQRSQQGHMINIFKDVQQNKNSSNSPNQKSFTLSIENKINNTNEKIGSKTKINSHRNANSSDQKDGKQENQQIKLFIPLEGNRFGDSQQLDLQKVFSTRLKQSVVLEKHHNETKILQSPSKDKSFTYSGGQTQPFKDSTSSRSKGANSPSITLQSRGGKSPQSIRGSRVSGFESSSVMFIEDDEEEVERQKKRREKSPLNYLFQKYPEVIKENYSFMKMKMKQIVDFHDTLEPTTEEKLIDDYQNYSDVLNNKLKNKLIDTSQKQNSKAITPLLNIKKGLNLQQKKLYSQINQLTHEVEVSKRQIKYLHGRQNQFNKTITDLESIVIPSSYFNVSDFIYKNYMKSKGNQRLLTQ